MTAYYEEYDEPYDDDSTYECDHEDYDADILTGRAMCYRCGHTWYQSGEEIEREQMHEREYQRWCQEQYRIEWLEERWWGRAWLALKRCWPATHTRG